MKRVLIVEDQRFARDHLENCVIKNIFRGTVCMKHAGLYE